MKLEPVFRKMKVSIIQWQLELFLIGLTVICFLSYIPGLSGPFISDDNIYIVNNPLLLSTPISEAWRLFTSKTNPWEFLPIRDLSFLIDFSLKGLDPFVFKLHNLVLYSLIFFIVLLCSKSILTLINEDLTSKQIRSGALCITLVFMSHPAHVESVVWISGRKELLNGLFCFCSLYHFLKVLSLDNLRSFHFILSIFFYLLSLLSKSSSVTLPIVFALIAIVYSRRLPFTSFASSILKLTLPFTVIAMIHVLCTINIGEQSGVMANNLFYGDMRSQAPITPFLIFGYMLKIVFYPFELRFIYDFSGEFSRYEAFCIALSFLACCIFCIFKWRRVDRLILIGIAWLATLSLPFLQLIPFNSSSIVAERFLFLPVWGAALIIFSLIQRISLTWRYPALLCLITAFSFTIYERSMQWQQESSLLESNAVVAPFSFTVQDRYINGVLIPQSRFEEAYHAAYRVKSREGRDYLKKLIDLRVGLRTKNTTLIINSIPPLLTLYHDYFYQSMGKQNTIRLLELASQYHLSPPQLNISNHPFYPHLSN